ncbi:MAG: aminotransferase class V-fold PLP-dependent enzyme [Planctomycetota bacterium]
MDKFETYDWDALREIFPITKNYNFMNHAAAAPLSTRAVEGTRRYLDHASAQSYLRGGFFKVVDRVRKTAASLVGANADEIAFTKGTSEGLSLVANGLSWQTGDNVVIANCEFPANVYPWQALRNMGVKVHMVMDDHGKVSLDSIIDAIDSRTRLVSISSIQYASGFRTDLATLGEYCQSKGVFLCVDAIQSLGAFPLDVNSMNIDFLSAGAHKWLCAPEGCGILFVKKQLQGYLRPTTVGWLSVKEPFSFGKHNQEFADTARRYEAGSYNLAGIFGMGAAMELALEIGIEQISKRLIHLTDRLVYKLRDKGYRVCSSREPAESSSIVSFTTDQHDQEAVQGHLENEHRIVVAVRHGRLRASPHMYTSEHEIDQLVECLPGH